MFEKAREFREKFSVTHESSDLIRANLILKKQAADYARKSARLRSDILVLEREIAMIESEINEFMLVYNEKFAGRVPDENIISGDPVRTGFYENDAMISFFDKKAEAYDKELKITYRRLVKNFHPDLNNDIDISHFREIQACYEHGQLDALLYIQAQIEEAENHENIIARIERLESQVRTYERKLVKLVERKSEIISSAEHKLFIRFRLSEIRGHNFFDDLLRRTGIRSAH